MECGLLGPLHRGLSSWRKATGKSVSFAEEEEEEEEEDIFIFGDGGGAR